MPHTSSEKTVLLIGASRGLGYALAQEYLTGGWRVVATVRGSGATPLHHLMKTADGRLEIETVDITIPEQIKRLHERLIARRFETFVLMAPGWVRTELGGPEARLSIEESIPNVVKTIEAQQGKTGLHYLDYLGRTVPW